MLAFDTDGNGVGDFALGNMTTRKFRIYQGEPAAPPSCPFTFLREEQIPWDAGTPMGVDAVDADGDRRSDLVAFIRTPGGIRTLGTTSTGVAIDVELAGSPSALPVWADYDCDGRWNAGVFDQGGWRWVGPQGVGTLNFGTPTDVPAAGRYFANQCGARAAVVRESTAAPGTLQWLLADEMGTNALPLANFGLSTDVVLAADYDGDGWTNVATYRAGDQVLYMQFGPTLALTTRQLPPGTHHVFPCHDGNGVEMTACELTADAGGWQLVIYGPLGTVTCPLGGDRLDDVKPIYPNNTVVEALYP